MSTVGKGSTSVTCFPPFEQVGRSLFGALSIRANAPDEGNMHTLEIGGSEDIKEEYLRPLGVPMPTVRSTPLCGLSVWIIRGILSHGVENPVY